jgi:hypothetical protein
MAPLKATLLALESSVSSMEQPKQFSLNAMKSPSQRPLLSRKLLRTPRETVYGVKNNVNDWNAAKCMSGEPMEKELQPDFDLGRSKKMNCTN